MRKLLFCLIYVFWLSCCDLGVAHDATAGSHGLTRKNGTRVTNLRGGGWRSSRQGPISTTWTRLHRRPSSYYANYVKQGIQAVRSEGFRNFAAGTAVGYLRGRSTRPYYYYSPSQANQYSWYEDTKTVSFYDRL